MNIIETEIEGLVVIEPDVYLDSRGCFFECYNSKKFIINNLTYFFVQDNEAESKFGVIRGLHFQKNPQAQTKLVRVSYGEVLDVAIDLRTNSSTFGKVFTILLSQQNKKQVLIPKGFAHGYSVLSPISIFNYKCDNYYSKDHESGIHPLDPHFNIDWQIPKSNQLVSPKDLALPFFQVASKF